MCHGYKCSAAAEPPPRSPHFVQIIPTIGGVMCGYRRLAKYPWPLTTIRNSYENLCHSGEVSMYILLIVIDIFYIIFLKLSFNDNNLQ